MNWLFGRQWSLSLKPDESGKNLAGFKSGNALTCVANDGEMISTVLDRFNTYRGPNQQIHKLWTTDGKEMNLSLTISKDLVAIVRSE